MKYLLLIYRSEAALQALSKSEMNEVMAAYGGYTEALRKAGVMIGGDALQGAAATTTVRVTNGKTQVLDGPYADIKEQLGGYYVLDVADLDAALTWASRCPGAAYGTVELRPIRAM